MPFHLLSAMPDACFVCPDFVGHGHSSHNTAPACYHFEDHFHSLYLLTEQLGWDIHHIMGHSMGAGQSSLHFISIKRDLIHILVTEVTIQYAALFHERVLTAILLDGGPGWMLPPDAIPETLVSQLADWKMVIGKKPKVDYYLCCSSV